MGRRQQWVYRTEPEEFPQDFPRRLDRFRQAAGLSWAELARLLRVNARTVRRWKAGAEPGSGHLFRLLELAAGRGLLHHLLPGAGRPEVTENEVTENGGGMVDGERRDAVAQSQPGDFRSF